MLSSQQIKDLLEKATRGEWHVYRCSYVDEYEPKNVSACGIGLVSYPTLDDRNKDCIVSDTNREECCHMMNIDDANLIAAAPTLAAQCLELMEENTRLNGLLDEIQSMLEKLSGEETQHRAGCTCPKHRHLLKEGKK